VDRVDVRRLMIGSDVLRAVITLAAAAVAAASPGIALLVVLCLVFGVVDSVFMPAVGSLQPRLLRPEQYGSGNALFQAANRIALTLGAPLGGVLVAFGGLSLACVVDAATFAVSVLTLWRVRPRPVADPPKRDERYLTTLRAGISYLAHNRVAGPLVLIGLLSNLGFVGPMNIGLALLSNNRGWGPSGVGLLLAAFGVGAAAGAMAMLRVRPRGLAGLVIAVACVLEAVGMLGMVWAPDEVLSVAASGFVGLVSGPLGVYCSTLSQRHTADAFRGRVSSVNTLASLGIAPQAMTLMGVVTAVFGLTASFVVSAGFELVAGALCLAFPAIRAARVPQVAPVVERPVDQEAELPLAAA
jgi:predicted MFS family arabinose efflux permease